MFVELATALAPAFGNNVAVAADAVLTGYRPLQISDFMEEFWRQGVQSPALFLGAPVVADLAELGRRNQIDMPLPGPLAPHVPPSTNAVGWNHLAYAYMLENTRMLEIFRRVVFEYVHGERLPNASQATNRWLRTTEELFFTSPRVASVRGLTSNLRPDDGAVRRNAYQRLLGLDVLHGTDDGRSYPYTRSDVANRDFSVLFEALLTEVWKGYTNRTNQVGPNETDDEAIRTLVRRIREMLQARRLAGNLSREEFDAVATLSWFHLVVLADTQIVVDLSAQAAGTADRLGKIGERVGLAAHARSDAYFELALPISDVLRNIENGVIGAAPPIQLYDGFWTGQMLTIITQWSAATGRELKDPTRRQSLNQTLLQTVRPTNGAAAYASTTRLSASNLAGLPR
jgi:hypothetical protein